jgi:RNA polymerase sigma-70 factor, ECF subfamily
MSDSKPATSETRRFEDWVREHGRAVRGYLWALTRDEAAADLTQEVFLRAWKARRRYEENGNARAYLLRIADRLATDRFRELARRPAAGSEEIGSLPGSVTTDDPATIAVQEEDVALLNAALADLSPFQRRVLLLRYYGQMPFAEIAESMELPVNTVLSHCRRGLEQLRKRLGKGVRVSE